MSNHKRAMQPAAPDENEKFKSIKRLFPNVMLFLKWFVSDDAVFYRALGADAAWLKENAPELCVPFSDAAPDADDVLIAGTHIENTLRRAITSGHKVVIIEDWQKTQAES